MKKIKNSQPQTKFTGSYKKKSVFKDFGHSRKIFQWLLPPVTSVTYRVFLFIDLFCVIDYIETEFLKFKIFF